MIVQANNLLGEGLWTLIVILILTAWFLASIIHQCRFRWWARVSRYDSFNLLPTWSFFAPNPGHHDFHLVYRDWVEGECGPWTEFATTIVETRWRWLWNPSRYPGKALTDLTNGIFRAVQLNVDEPRVVILSSSYLSLLHLVMAQPPASPKVDRRQFAILRTRDFGSKRQIEVAFVSEEHRAAF